MSAAALTSWAKSMLLREARPDPPNCD